MVLWETSVVEETISLLEEIFTYIKHSFKITNLFYVFIHHRD